MMIVDYSQIKHLVDSNIEIKLSQDWLDTSRLKIKSIATSFIPEVALYAKTENDNLSRLGRDKSAGAFASVNLFNGFKDVKQNQLIKIDYEVKNINHKKTYNELYFMAKSDYWYALKNQEYIKTLREYQSINKINNGLIVKKVSGGLIPKSEELNSKKIDFNISEEMVKARDELSILKSDLRKLFSLSKNETVEILGSIDHSKFDLPKVDKKLDLALVKLEEEKSWAENSISSYWRMPKINFYIDQSFSELKDGEYLDKRDNQARVFGVKLILPLISEKDNDTIADQVKKSEYDISVLRRKAQILERENEDEKKEISINYLRNSIERSKSKVDLSKEILSKITAEFKSGIKEADSLNDAAEKYIEAQRDLLDHQVEYILAIEKMQLNNLD
ncbi:MAG: TolC family protein [Bacteriovorax sp.]|nr:TolC family protein [Bacteriovorax sp.]